MVVNGDFNFKHGYKDINGAISWWLKDGMNGLKTAIHVFRIKQRLVVVHDDLAVNVNEHGQYCNGRYSLIMVNNCW